MQIIMHLFSCNICLINLENMSYSCITSCKLNKCCSAADKQLYHHKYKDSDWIHF